MLRIYTLHIELPYSVYANPNGKLQSLRKKNKESVIERVYDDGGTVIATITRELPNDFAAKGWQQSINSQLNERHPAQWVDDVVMGELPFEVSAHYGLILNEANCAPKSF